MLTGLDPPPDGTLTSGTMSKGPAAPTKRRSRALQCLGHRGAPQVSRGRCAGVAAEHGPAMLAVTRRGGARRPTSLSAIKLSRDNEDVGVTPRRAGARGGGEGGEGD